MARRFSNEIGEPEPTAEVSAEGAPAGDAPPPAPPVPPPADAPPDGPELLTPNEWAARKGLLVPGVEAHGKEFHDEAAQLHGWKRHAYDEQDPDKAFRLSEADYDAARDAAAHFPAKPAHKPALPPGILEPELPKHLQPPATPAPTSGA